MQSILIIEDESAIADTLAYVLKTEGYAPHWCTLGNEGLERLRSGDFALVVLDVGLPDMSGFEVCRQLRMFSDVPVIFLTSRGDEVDRIVGLEIGADDYVSKPFSPREVAARVRVILRRYQGRDTTPSRVAPQCFEVDTAGSRIRYFGSVLDLTRYEYLLLQTLLEHPDRVFTRAELMDRVWRDALETSDRTVDTHIKTLRGKLKALREDLDPISTHRGMGYSISNRMPGEP